MHLHLTTKLAAVVMMLVSGMLGFIAFGFIAQHEPFPAMLCAMGIMFLAVVTFHEIDV